MKDLKIKICGMKNNPEEVALLKPDYLGFIFYDKSPRNFTGTIPSLPNSIKKVGVFVNETHKNILNLVQHHQLDVLQLHGEETEEDILQLKLQATNKGLKTPEIWKVFSVDHDFNFDKLRPFEKLVDAYLFDTKGPHYGGNGIAFNWDLLAKYPSQKPFFLSGGIGPEHGSILKEWIQNNQVPLLGIDLNSKFELAPGHKNISALKTFIDEL